MPRFTGRRDGPPWARQFRHGHTGGRVHLLQFGARFGVASERGITQHSDRHRFVGHHPVTVQIMQAHFEFSVNAAGLSGARQPLHRRSGGARDAAAREVTLRHRISFCGFVLLAAGVSMGGGLCNWRCRRG